MQSKKDILRKIKRHYPAIENYGVKRIGIFGSFIHRAQKRLSDVDVIVEFKNGEKTFDNYMDLKNFLEKIFHRKVDLVIKEAIKSSLRIRILKEIQYA